MSTQSRQEDQGSPVERELLLRLQKALEQLQSREGLGGEERLDNLVFRRLWEDTRDLASARDVLRLAREASGGLPARTRALAGALDLLLGELLLALAAAEGESAQRRLLELWDQGMLDSRLRHHYLLELVAAEKGEGARPPAEARGVGELRRRLARRWEDELMPLAVGLVLCEAGILCRQEDWRQLVRGRPDRMKFRLEPTPRQRRFLDQLCRILPEAISRLRDDLEKLLWGNDPADWYQRRPSAGYVAFIIRYLLHDTPWPHAREGADDDPDARRQELRRFLESWKWLVAQNLQRGLRRRLRELDSRFASLPADKLLDVLERLGREPGLPEEIPAWIDCLAEKEASRYGDRVSGRAGSNHVHRPGASAGEDNPGKDKEKKGPVRSEDEVMLEVLASALRRAGGREFGAELLVDKLAASGALDEEELASLREKMHDQEEDD